MRAINQERGSVCVCVREGGPVSLPLSLSVGKEEERETMHSLFQQIFKLAMHATEQSRQPDFILVSQASTWLTFAFKFQVLSTSTEIR